MAYKYHTLYEQDPEDNLQSSPPPVNEEKRSLCFRWGLAALIPFLVLASVQGAYFLNGGMLLSPSSCFKDVEGETVNSSEDGWSLHESNFRESAGGGRCWAVAERHLYYPKTQHPPAPALLDALREYERLHQRCTVGVVDWAQHFSQLQAGYEDCQYIVWTERPEGLGNRLSSILGAFAYALLTRRVLLIDASLGMDRLLCNPMPFSSWWLPKDFPTADLRAAPHQGVYLNADDPALGSKKAVELYLEWYLGDDDMKFFCDEGQRTVTNVTWAAFSTNQYIGPALWLLPMFQEKLHTLYPDRRMFSHLIRYIMLPVNEVWEKVARSYQAYFTDSDTRVGAQIRSFSDYDPVVTQRVFDCLTSKAGLPGPVSGEHNEVMLAQTRTRAAQKRQRPPHRLLFLASMHRQYFVDFRRIYTERPTEDGSIVAVFAEEAEGVEDHHVAANQRAMADMLLLSMSDVLLISYASTFGSVVNGLAGHNNTFFMNICDNTLYNQESQYKHNNRTVCERAWGQESCHGFQQPLPCNNWRDFGSTSPNKWYPHLVACQDMQAGLTLIPTYT